MYDVKRQRRFDILLNSGFNRFFTRFNTHPELYKDSLIKIVRKLSSIIPFKYML